MSLIVRRLTSEEIADALPAIARLRIEVFRDWPYLYDGDLAYEENYLAAYRDNPRAVVVGAFDGDRLVGASTATPMTDHADDFAAAFAGTSHALDRLFYCAESVLLSRYRGQGAGGRFFDEREAAAREQGFKTVAFCAVIRPPDHPARPEDHRPLDNFWRRRGYQPAEGVIAHFSWKDLGEAEETEKPLQFWLKSLSA